MLGICWKIKISQKVWIQRTKLEAVGSLLILEIWGGNGLLTGIDEGGGCLLP